MWFSAGPWLLALCVCVAAGPTTSSAGPVMEVIGTAALSAVRGVAEPGRIQWCGQTFFHSGDLDGYDQSEWWWHPDKNYLLWEPDTLIAARYALRHPEEASGPTGPATVLDLGAWTGPFAAFATSFEVDVVAVEPSPKAFQKLLKNLAAQPRAARARTVAVRAAVGDAFDEPVQRVTDTASAVDVLCWAKSSASGRSYRGSCQDPDSGAAVDVAVVTIEDLWQRLPQLANTRLMKMDVEGYESVLVPAVSRFLSRVRAAAIVALHPSYLSDDVGEGHRAVQRVGITLARIFPFVYLISTDRQQRGRAPRLLHPQRRFRCHFIDGCQVLGLWAPLDYAAWNASAASCSEAVRVERRNH